MYEHHSVTQTYEERTFQGCEKERTFQGCDKEASQAKSAQKNKYPLSDSDLEGILDDLEPSWHWT